MNSDDGGQEEEEDIWWYVCTLCFQSFKSGTKCRTHKRLAHGSKNAANLLILSQTADLEPRVNVARCDPATERNIPVDGPQTPDVTKTESISPQRQATPPPSKSPPFQQCKLCSNAFVTRTQLRAHVLAAHVADRGVVKQIKMELEEPHNESQLDHEASDAKGMHVVCEHPIENPQFSTSGAPSKWRAAKLASAMAPAGRVKSKTKVKSGCIDNHMGEPEAEISRKLRPRIPKQPPPPSASDSEPDNEDVDDKDVQVSELEEEDEPGEDSEPGGEIRLQIMDRKRSHLQGRSKFKSYACPECYQAFSSGQIGRHFDAAHGDHIHLLKEGKDCYCMICHQDTFLRPSLSRGDGVWDCKLCGQSMKEAEIQEHVQVVHPDQKPQPSTTEAPSEWRIAKLVVLKINDHGAKSMKLDYARDAKQLRYKCTECENSYASRKYLKVHMRSTHSRNGVKAKCPICDKVFSTKDSLRHHQATVHAESRDHLCPTCGSTFTSAGELRTHMVYHDPDGRKYVCKVCTKPFFRSTAMHHHQRGHNPPEVMCHDCGKLFKTERALRQHHRRQHLGMIPFKCEKCGATFQTSNQFKRHAGAHVEGTPHACPQCPKAFKTKYHLKDHVTGCHEGKGKPKVHICRICKQEFPGRQTLLRHELEAHNFQRGRVKFECKHCNAKFASHFNYKQHQIVHTNERGFRCDHPGCDKTFDSAGHLKQHRVTHLPYDELSNVCNCGKRFGLASQLRYHKKRIHEKEPQKSREVEKAHEPGQRQKE